MNTQHHHTQKISMTGMELILLFLIFAGMGAQVVLGTDHTVFLFFRLIYTPGMVFLAGLYVAYNKNNIRFLLKRAALYAVLFLGFGLCNLVLLNHKLPFQSLVRLVTMIKIPTPSEIFFTLTVLFLCAALTAKHIQTIYTHRKRSILLSAAALLFAFFPSDIFGYPIIGVFTDCNTYDCIALLPYTIFFISGILAEKYGVKFNKKALAATAISTFISVVLFFTPLKDLSVVTAAALPVYVIYLFSLYCTPFLKITAWLNNLYQKILKKLKQWYTDFSYSRKNVLPLYFIVYTFLFLFMTACVFFSFIEYDNSIAWLHDPISQYIPRIHYFSDYIKECVSKLLDGNLQFSSYTFRSGLGNSVPLSFEPVYWLFALFDSENVEFAYNFITIFRFFLAGLSASIFFLYHKRGYFESLLGSMMYTFCGFAIYAGVLHAHFIAPMIFLPLLLIATEEVFRKKRWYLCTLFVAVALPSNYYFIYMSTIAMGIYYIGRFLFTRDKEKKTWKYFFTATAAFAGSYLLGVVIGNISLFTSFASYMSSGRTGNSEIQALSLFFYKDTWLARLFTYFISAPATPGAWLKLGFIPLSYLAIVVIFMKKGQKLLKFLFLTCLSFCVFPIAAFVLGGFSTITNRWCYILALLVSYITVRAIPELRNLSRRELKILFIALLPYVLIILAYRDYRSPYSLASLAVLLCNYVVILCMNRNLCLLNRNTANLALMVLCCAALTLNAYYQYLGGRNTSENSFAKQGHVLDEITDTPMKVLDNYPDDSFYRVSTAEIPRKNLSSSLVMDYNSIAVFSSTISGPIINYNVEMANTAWNLVQLGGFDNRTFMNSLACVKYYSLREKEKSRLPYGYKEIGKEKRDGETYYIYENETPLPLGYTYDSVLSEEELAKYSPLERQEIMLQSAVVEDKNKTPELTAPSPTSTSKEVKITDFQADGIEIKDGVATVTKPGATLKLTFDGLENSETYLVYDGVCNPGKNNDEFVAKTKLVCGDYKRNYEFRSSNHTYSTGQETFLFNMGYRKDAANSCTITFKNKGSFTYESLKVYCQPMDSYNSYIEDLTKDALEDVEINANTITGKVSTDKEKLLVLSIPYQKGWTAYIDGKKADIHKANLMYSGLFLSPGEHDIRLEFERPGIKASLCLSAVGIVILAIALIIRRRRIKMKK